MKKILLLAVFIMCAPTIFAQKISYQGEVSLGYSAGIGASPIDRVPLHIINGARFNDYLFVGVGAGIEYYCYYKDFLSRKTYAIPIYVNVKGYLPASKAVSPFLGLDFGYGIGVGEFSGYGGLLVTPAIGVNFKVAQGFSMNFSVGYAYQQSSESTLFSTSCNAISIKVGFQF